MNAEAHAIAALNHPHICQIYDIGPNYLIDGCVEGTPLVSKEKPGPLPLDEALRMARQIAAALEAAHEKHITHRDLKPGNIMLKPDGTVKVLDFGLAKITTPARTDLSPENSPTLTLAATQMGMILGTAAYMAPEQAKGKEVDKRADIWAFGVVFYELVTGSRPFPGTDMSEILASVIKEDPSYESVPYELRRLLKKCLEKDPAKRLRDIGDVWELLEEAPSPLIIAASAPPPPSRRRALPWALAAVLTAVAAVWLTGWHRSAFAGGTPTLVRLDVDLGTWMWRCLLPQMEAAVSPSPRMERSRSMPPARRRGSSSAVWTKPGPSNCRGLKTDPGRYFRRTASGSDSWLATN